MGHMKELDRRIRQGGDDAIEAVSEYVKELEGEVASARACAEMMLQGTGQKLGEELARRVIDEHYPPRWIPVEDRLPEDGQSVLACFEKSGGVGCATFVERHKWFETDRGCFGATHWMPLPAPPTDAK